MRPPNYGKLHTKYICSEVKNIWYSKNEELADLPKLDPMPCFCTGLNSVENKQIYEFLYKRTNLQGQERQVFYMRYVLEMTLQEVGDCLFVSKERIRQIEDKALRRLKRVANLNDIVKYGDSYEFH
jgi:RNA polymerase sigma factor (sigma-70 family)